MLFENECVNVDEQLLLQKWEILPPKPPLCNSNSIHRAQHFVAVLVVGWGCFFVSFTRSRYI